MAKSITSGKTSRRYLDRKSGRISHTEIGTERYVESFTTDKFTPVTKKQARQIKRIRTAETPKPGVTQAIIPKQTIKQHGKVLYTIEQGELPGSYIQKFPATQKWRVTHGVGVDERIRTFDSEPAAKRYVSSLKTGILEEAHRAQEASFTADHKAYDDQISNLRKLVRMDVAVKKDDKYVLTIQPTELTDEALKVARKAGFNIQDIPEAPSFRLFEWGQEATKEGSFTRSQTEYYATVLGAGERVVGGIYNAITNAVKGTPIKFRSVSQETLSLVKDLSPQERAYLSVGAFGGSYLGGMTATIPIGIGASLVFQGARNIASAAGVSAPSAIARIAGEISKHPQLAKAVMWAPIAGIEVNKVYKDYEAGVPLDDIIGEEIIRVGAILGQVKGLEIGYKLPSKVNDWLRTRGRTAIPPEELFRAVTLETGALPTYEGTWRDSWSKQFKDLAKELTAEEYLGKLAHDEYRVWHGRKSPFPYEGGEPWSVEVGDSLGKFPGLFVSAEPSPLRLPGGVGSGSRLGLPGVGGVAELATIDALVDVMPKGLSRAAAQKWLTQQVGTGTAYIPPVSMITPEIEAIIPPESLLMKTGEKWYTNWAGHRVLVNQYVLIPEGIPLAALPKGFELVALSSLTSTSLPITETYLTYGIIPTTSMLSSMELSPAQITALSELYDLSESDIRLLSSTLSTTISGITETGISTEVTDAELTVSDLNRTLGTSEDPPSIYEPTPPPTITEPTPPPTEPEPTPPPEPPPTPPPIKPDEVDIEVKLKDIPKPRLGRPGKYKVTLKYRTKATEVKGVTASNYIEAISKGVAASRNKRQLIEVEAERVS